MINYFFNNNAGKSFLLSYFLHKETTQRRIRQIVCANFKVDKKLVNAINKENTFERTSGNPSNPSPYTLEERLQRALSHIDRHGFITLQEYANLNRLSYSSASRELAKLVANPQSGIKAKGTASHKVWVRR